MIIVKLNLSIKIKLKKKEKKKTEKKCTAREMKNVINEQWDVYYPLKEFYCDTFINKKNKQDNTTQHPTSKYEKNHLK